MVRFGLLADRVLTCTEPSSVGELGRTVLIIDGGRIADIVPISALPAATDGDDDSTRALAAQYSLTRVLIFPPGSTVMPGFIDCHVHLTLADGSYQIDHLRRSSADMALRALRAAQGLLQVHAAASRVAARNVTPNMHCLESSASLHYPRALLHKHQAGFTTLRSAGEADTGFPVIAVARAIERGEFDGAPICDSTECPHICSDL